MPIVQDVVKNQDGQEVAISIEVDEPIAYDPFSETRGTTEYIKHSFEQAMGLIQICAEQVASAVHTVSEKARPTDFEIQLAIKIDAQVGAIIAKSSTEAQLQVTLKWSKKDS